MRLQTPQQRDLDTNPLGFHDWNFEVPRLTQIVPLPRTAHPAGGGETEGHVPSRIVSVSFHTA